MLQCKLCGTPLKEDELVIERHWRLQHGWYQGKEIVRSWYSSILKITIFHTESIGGVQWVCQLHCFSMLGYHHYSLRMLQIKWIKMYDVCDECGHGMLLHGCVDDIGYCSEGNGDWCDCTTKGLTYDEEIELLN